MATAGALVAGACSYSTALDVTEPTLAESTAILAADGSPLTTLVAEENRENVVLGELPDHVVDAVIAIEDARFWTHRGVDVKAVVRAAKANTDEGSIVQGGSTITQQYVKNTVLDADQSIERKINEALLALELERRYTKERILELYLNTIYFGNGAYGVHAAAKEYFGITAAELSLAQSATLAGLIRAPSAFDPHDAPDAAVARRDHVLHRMAELGLVEADVSAKAEAEPLVLAERTAGDRYPAPHFVEQVKRFILDDPRFGATPGERQALLFGGGLRITTTLDPRLQAQAEEAVSRVRPPEPGPDAALVSIEPRTGFVRALVGGRDFFGGGASAKLDLTTGGPGRPAGSAFKPLVLAAALEEGISLDQDYAAPARLTIPLTSELWQVENYEGSDGGRATLFEATLQSYNTVYAQLIQEVGPADAVAMASRLGIRSPLQPFPSAVLGTNDVHPLEMASAYATFANRGLRVAPAFVTRVLRRDGTVLYSHAHAQERVLEADVADRVNSALQGVIAGGTGVRARIGRPAAGKTGTGQQWRDAWFVGYTQELSTAVWFGFRDEGTRSMVPPATPMRVSGGTWPATTWQLFMAAALAEAPVTGFPAPRPSPPPAEEEEEEEEPASARVTDVVGMPVETSEAALSRAGFVVQRREVPSKDYPPGYVVGQQPAGGEKALGGTTVVLDVANGEPVSVEAPDVLGVDEATALARIEGAGLVADVVVEAEPAGPTSPTRARRSWKQRPAVGQLVASRSAVTVWLNP
ncbi:MAG: transglycosylase domain-containing protein [Actinomycetota bacterium]|nr:transglycosylase domain-containing protein [Actinomycetota bacterium]